MIEFITDGSYVQLKDNEGLKERLHNTSTAFSWSISDTGVINFIVDGMKYENVPIADIYFDGVVCASHADFVTNIQGLFTNLAGGGGAASYLVYTALLSQTGTDAPTATVLENTLGGTVVWTRTDVGKYLATLSNVFVVGRTVIFATPDLWNGNAEILYVGLVDASNIYVESRTTLGTNDMGTPNYIKIMVYPA